MFRRYIPQKIIGFIRIFTTWEFVCESQFRMIKFICYVAIGSIVVLAGGWCPCYNVLAWYNNLWDISRKMPYILSVLRCQLIKVLPSTRQVWLTRELVWPSWSCGDCIKKILLDWGCLFWLSSLIFFFVGLRFFCGDVCFCYLIYLFCYPFVIYLESTEKIKNSWTFKGYI